MIIRTPVKGASGIYANTLFSNGVGRTDNPAAIEYFKSHGYTVEEEESGKDDFPDFDSMTGDEIRAWAQENGYRDKVKNYRNKERLIGIIRG